MAPANSASTAAGPALKTVVSRVVSPPSASAMKPFSTPISAGEWVTLPKKPSRSVSAGVPSATATASASVPAAPSRRWLRTRTGAGERR